MLTSKVLKFSTILSKQVRSANWVGFNQDSKTLVNVWMQICAKFSSKQTIMSLYRQSAGILPFVTHRDDRSRPTNLDSAEPLRHGKISAAKNGLVPCHPLGWRSFQRGILSHRCPYLHSTRTQHPFSTRCRSSIIEDGTNYHFWGTYRFIFILYFWQPRDCRIHDINYVSRHKY